MPGNVINDPGASQTVKEKDNDAEKKEKADGGEGDQSKSVKGNSGPKAHQQHVSYIDVCPNWKR